jgi:hypothetical protein
MHISQLKKGGVVCRRSSDARLVNGADSTYALALEAIESGHKLAAVIERHGLGARGRGRT